MLLRVRQAAEEMSCAKSTIYDLCRQGLLRHLRVGAGRGSIRIRKEDLDDYIESRVTGGIASPVVDAISQPSQSPTSTD